VADEPKDYLFNWDEILETDKASLVEFLRLNYGINWVKTANIKKSSDGKTIEISDGNNSLSLRLNDEKMTVNLTINSVRTDEFIVKMKDGKPNIYTKKITEQRRGPGEYHVGPKSIVLITGYMILFTILLLSSFVLFWPCVTKDSGCDTVVYLWRFPIFGEVRSLVNVMLAGALGSMLHALRSFYKYVGQRELVWSWLAMYILLPFVGASIGLVFYLIIRGGFFSPTATVNETSPFGFMALAALAGLFSEPAVLKLREVALTLLTDEEEGKDHIYLKPKTKVDTKTEKKGKETSTVGDEHKKED
jgi:hypothetical protein